MLGTRWIDDTTTDPVPLVAFERALAGEQVPASEEIWDAGSATVARQRGV